MLDAGMNGVSAYNVDFFGYFMSHFLFIKELLLTVATFLFVNWNLMSVVFPCM